MGSKGPVSMTSNVNCMGIPTADTPHASGRPDVSGHFQSCFFASDQISVHPDPGTIGGQSNYGPIAGSQPDYGQATRPGGGVEGMGGGGRWGGGSKNDTPSGSSLEEIARG